MDDAQDQHNLAFDFIEDAMAAVEGRADQAAKFGLPRADPWMPFQPVPDFVEAARVICGDFIAKRLRTVLVDFRQVGPRFGAESDFNHAGRDARR